VQVACAVIQKTRHAGASEFTAIVTENEPSATSAALRQLRKLNGATPSSPVEEEGWNLFPVPVAALRARPTWRLPAPSTNRVLRALGEAMLPTIGDLFDVAQGVQTGLNEALLLTEEEWRALPAKERSLFRLATMSDSIQNGRVNVPYRVFFPHTPSGPMFPDEDSLKRAAPSYFKKYLAPYRERLAARAAIVRSKRFDWWGLMHPRDFAFEKTPRIISKFFAAEGGFVGDYKAAYLPVMGHVWFPKIGLTEGDVDALPTTDILAAYVALFNSTPFVRLLAVYSPHVAGGQYDLSLRHVAPIPVPNLRELSVDPQRGQSVLALAVQGMQINLSDPLWNARTVLLVNGLYGAHILDGL